LPTILLCSLGCDWWLVLIYYEKKYWYLPDGWWLVLIWCERKTLLADWLTS